jgi:hypothetical protein
MRLIKLAPLPLILLALAACSLPVATEPPSPTAAIVSPIEPTDEPTPLAPTPLANGQDLPCPGDPEQARAGYVGTADEVTLPDEQPLVGPALLTIPAHDGRFAGIFGAYPRYVVQSGDVFQATLACIQAETPCQPDFELAYLDSSGGYHTIATSNGLEAAEGLRPFEVDLGPLAGREVRLMLVVRDRGNREQGSRAVWLAPVVWRDESRAHQPSRPQSPGPLPTPAGGIPGVVSGIVDMASAPPYLNDPVVGPSAVVVMFFNLDDGTWWWFHNTAMRPAFQMTVPTGRYHVVAYGRGVGDMPYVAAGYTGQAPSCGQPLAEVTVGSNARVEGLVIADWNWTCGGTAYRPPKPDAVPLP